MMDVAEGATFNFSFSNENGAVNGTVSGVIELPDGDFSNQPATSLIVNSAPSALGYTLPLDVLSFSTIGFNSFTVSGGQIDAVNSAFSAQDNNSNVFRLNRVFGTLLTLQGSNNSTTGVQDSDNSTLVYSSALQPVTTPEPSSIITFIGIGVLGLVSKRKK